jgi:plastocyanin
MDMARHRLSIVRLLLLCATLSILPVSEAAGQCTAYTNSIQIQANGSAKPDPACVKPGDTITFSAVDNSPFATVLEGDSPFVNGQIIHATGIKESDQVDPDADGTYPYPYGSCIFSGAALHCQDPKIIVQPDNLKVFPTIVTFSGHESVRDVAIVNVGKTAMKVEITPHVVNDSGCGTLAAGQACIVKITRTPSNAEGETRKFTVTYTGGSKTITVRGPGK